VKRTIPLLVLGLAGAVLWLASRENVTVTPEEIGQRCERSAPSWESYQEDIKGQVGAGPVAEWTGQPQSVQVGKGEVQVDFAIGPPWGEYDAALPVLLRDSFGATCRHDAVERVDQVRRYHFPLQGEALQRPPSWVELRFPHSEAWVPLDTDGRWRKDSN